MSTLAELRRAKQEAKYALFAAGGRAMTASEKHGHSSPEHRAARGWATRRRRAFSDLCDQVEAAEAWLGITSRQWRLLPS